MKNLLILLVLNFIQLNLFANQLIVGSNARYSSISDAAQDALPGDTIYVLEGSYIGGMRIAELQGQENAWIRIIGEEGKDIIINGANTALQLTDAEYVEINGIIFQNQSTNCVNIDDAGSFDSPTHHIHIRNCTFRDIQGLGNFDLLKLSGLDDFIIEGCEFLNGASGGSGIDMVGCHDGLIQDNHFENMGSNSIQAKGGTQFIRIARNKFINGGQRNINLGGSTGLQFFRPQDAPFEAADLQVYANTFVGGYAGVAFVGCTRVDVANNTFYFPENWVFRILQETVDESRFVKCGNSSFRNNIIYYGAVHRDVNVGPNTSPETFMINNNLWFKPNDTSFSGPNLPVTEQNAIIQEDPLFLDVSEYDFTPENSSPVIGQGETINNLTLDHVMELYNRPPSIGAYEVEPLISSTVPATNEAISIYPIPATDFVYLSRKASFIVTNLLGYKVQEMRNQEQLDIRKLPTGLYFIIIENQTVIRFLKN